MPRLLTLAAALILGVHGLIHLIGTTVYLKLGSVQGFTYKTTILGGRVNLGESGTAIFGALWALPAVGFVAVAVALVAGWGWWRPTLVVITLLSLVLTTLDWSVAYAGVAINVVILTLLWLGAAMFGAVAAGDDATRALPGDARTPSPMFDQTLAVTIDAPPESVWPWLVQMGYRRGGLYSYDWLDRLFGFLDAPSAERILPEFQHLSVGDQIPIARGGNFPVVGIQPNRALVLGGDAEQMHWCWQLCVYPLAERSTRLVSRSRGQMPPGIKTAVMLAILEPAALIMTRKMLLGIKRRAESLARQ
jgi:hypothetical protein